MKLGQVEQFKTPPMLGVTLTTLAPLLHIPSQCQFDEHRSAGTSGSSPVPLVTNTKTAFYVALLYHDGKIFKIPDNFF